MQAQVIRVTKNGRVFSWEVFTTLRFHYVNFEWYRTLQGKTTLYIDCTYIIVVSLQCELFNGYATRTKGRKLKLLFWHQRWLGSSE
jgi:hypothetical protein